MTSDGAHPSSVLERPRWTPACRHPVARLPPPRPLVLLFSCVCASPASRICQLLLAQKGLCTAYLHLLREKSRAFTRFFVPDVVSHAAARDLWTFHQLVVASSGDERLCQ
jgi:hypothetical protein